jgi:lysophospholipase L1-like esterase
VTFGARVPTAAAWPAQLEGLLQEAGHNCRVLNAGVSGYDPSQEVDWLEVFGWDLEPDAIAIGFCRNDVQLSNRNSSLAHQRLGNGLRWVSEHSLLAHCVEHAVWFCAGRIGFISGTVQKSEAGGWPLVENSYRRLASLARARRLPVILVIFPKLPFINGKTADDYAPHLHSLGNELGWTVIDLDPAFAADAERLFLPGDAIHLNPDGYCKAAHAIARVIGSQQFSSAR